MSYYDIDDILSESRLVSCKFRCDSQGMAELDPSASKDQVDLLKDTKVDLPVWLARWLASARYVSMELPQIYKPRAQAELRAACASTDLHAKSPYFYELGLKLAKIYAPINPTITRDLTDLLRHVLVTRLNETILARATPHARDQSAVSFYNTLTELERRIYDQLMYGLRELALWRRGVLQLVSMDPFLFAAKLASRKRKAMASAS